MKLICLEVFLIGLVYGKVTGNGASSSTNLETQQHTIVKEYFREEFDDEGKWYIFFSVPERSVENF